jgi:hypothetical protein
MGAGARRRSRRLSREGRTVELISPPIIVGPPSGVPVRSSPEVGAGLGRRAGGAALRQLVRRLQRVELDGRGDVLDIDGADRDGGGGADEGLGHLRLGRPPGRLGLNGS